MDKAKLPMMKNVLLAGVAAITVFAGLAAAPVGMPPVATAQQIVIDPPKGAPLSFADLIERVSPAVVSIEARGKPREDEVEEALEGLPPELEQFFRNRPRRQQPQLPSTSVGSGFFISADGLVVTNHHVVEGADEITVRTSKGDEFTAELIGTDQETDIAVLRVKRDGQPFPFVVFDRDADLRVGDWVVAVGNPFGLEGTATAGIVSAMGRRNLDANYVDFLQIDAPINRGNSGGPTFDLRGRVVGVNSQILSPTGGNVGIGFAIPSETASAIVDQLVSSGKVTRGWLGVQVQALDDDLSASFGLDKDEGALVADVLPGGPAERAGLQKRDVILRINGEKVKDSRDLTRKIGSAPVGSTAKIDILRDGARKSVSVKLAERDGEAVLANANPTPGGRSAEEGAKQAQLGVEVRPMTLQESRERGASGLVITEMSPESPLARKGIRASDAILRAGDRNVSSVAELNAAVEAALRQRRPLLLEIERNGQTLYVAADVAKQG